MHKVCKHLINKAIKNQQLKGPVLSCPYYPCHRLIEDCTFCYCPFYPCNNPKYGGKLIISKKTNSTIWDCTDCVFPHANEHAKKVLKAIIDKKKKFEEITHEEMEEIYQILVTEDKK